MPTGATRQGGHGIDFDSEEDGGGRDTQAMRNVPAGVGATGVMGGPSMRSGYTDTSSQPYSDPSSYHNSHQQHYYDQGAAAYQSGYPTAEHPYASAAPPAAGLAYNPGGASNGQLAMPDYGGVQERHGAIGQTNDWLSPAPSHPVGGNGAPTATSNSVSTPSTNIPSPSSEQISSGPSDLERSGTVLSQHEPSRPLGVANA